MMMTNTAAGIRLILPTHEEEEERLMKLITAAMRAVAGLVDDQPRQHYFSRKDHMSAYTIVYNLCALVPSQPRDECLYGKYKESLLNFIKIYVLPPLREKHDAFMLMELDRRWVNYRLITRLLSGVFNYLDRFFIPRRSLPGLNLISINSFHELVYNEFNSKVRDAIITLINKDREGEQIDRALMKNVIGIFVELESEELSLYQRDFEEYLLQDAAAYYSHKASDWIQHESCPTYLLKSEECLQKEKERASHYLHISSEPKLVERFQHEVLMVHQSELLEKENSGCRALNRDNKAEDLARMFSVYHNVPQGLEPVAHIFKQHITDEGTALINQAEDGTANIRQTAVTGGEQKQVLVTKILELHDKYLTYVADYFGKHTLFLKALKEAFVTFCNKTIAGCTSAEVLATFCDNVLKAGTQNSYSASEETLEKGVNLLAYVNDKDVFAEFYKKKLACRLLFDRNSTCDLELIILSKLKQRCGRNFTLKMEAMVRDVLLTKENQTSFQEYLSQAIGTGIDFSVTVLTTGSWPNYKSFNLLLPAEMVRCVEVFKKYYSEKTKNRKLTWVFSLGTCHINGKFVKKTIELIVSTQQAAALMLFNASDRLSYSEIKSQLNMDDDDLVRLLCSLSCAKYKILNKDPADTKTISKNDCFQFNHMFTDRMRRIKIALPPVEERKKVMEDVNKDRSYAIDAAIVRIMKSRKVLNYQQLVLECVEQLNCTFKPDIKAIKKRVEDLISRDYLERDEEDPNNFKYIA